MPKQCLVTHKSTSVGFHVSHSKRHVKRKLYPNLAKRRVMNPATKKLQTVWITAAGMRTLAKWDREGKHYDLNALKSTATKKG